MPLINAAQDVWTFRDGVDYLLDTHEIDRTGLNERRARMALLKAYRDLPSRAAWNYYARQRILQTVASYSTGTIAFDYTGGAAERLVTLSSGTFPTWAAFGKIIIDSVHYEVDTYESSTTITLRSDSNPGADVAAGTTYTIYRNTYPLPADFKELISLWDVDQNRELPIVSMPEYHDNAYLEATPTDPRWASISGSRDYYGGTQLIFGPPPNDIYSYDLLYKAAPRPLAIDEYSTGTVEATSASATITGTNTTFPTNCVGSIIRFSTSATMPTGIAGGLDDVDNPFAMQGVIKTRSSATSLILEEAASMSISAGSAYVISDPLDIDNGSMLTALLHAAEAEFARLCGRADAMGKESLARRSLLEAMEADNKIANRTTRRFYNPYTRTALTSE